MQSGILRGTRRNVARAGLALGVAAVLAALAATSGSGSIGVARTTAAANPSSSCHLGNGIQHVINIVFDNVHFSRDNPNVPSDLEQMPTLMNFLEKNGTVLSNM